MSQALRTQELIDWTCDQTGLVATTTGGLPAGWAQVTINGHSFDLSPTVAAPFLAALQATLVAIQAAGRVVP